MIDDSIQWHDFRLTGAFPQFWLEIAFNCCFDLFAQTSDKVPMRKRTAIAMIYDFYNDYYDPLLPHYHVLAPSAGASTRMGVTSCEIIIVSFFRNIVEKSF
jgi:hypothetical protein